MINATWLILGNLKERNKSLDHDAEFVKRY